MPPYQTYRFKVLFQCDACRTWLPVNGIASTIKCYHCGEARRLGRRFWVSAIEPEYFRDALKDPDREQETGYLGGSVRTIYSAWKQPYCTACQLDLDAALLEAQLPRGAWDCPGCGVRSRLRAADEVCQAINPLARFMLRETCPDRAEQASREQTRPVVTACMNCGATLNPDGSTRTVSCQYCDASNYLPDGLWLQLNPVPKPSYFFMICDHDPAVVLEVRWRDVNARCEDARKRTLSAAQLERLAADASPAVRRAVADNRAAPAALIARLLEDPEVAVVHAAARNPNLPAALLEGLATSEDSARRSLAAQNPALPHELLRRLARDRNKQVAQIAKHRIRVLESAGVKVGGKKSLLGKLFGG